MKTVITFGLCALAMLLAAPAAGAQEARPQIKTLGVGETAPTKALRTTAQKSGQTDSLNRLTDSLNEHLMVTFQNTHKFDIIARADLAALLKEQQLPAGLITDSEAKALPGKIRRLDFLLLTSITDFLDAKDGAFIEGQGVRVDRRTVQATMVIKIFNTSTGSLMQSIVLPVSHDQRGISRVANQGSGNGAIDDSLIEAVVGELAIKAAGRVVDIIYPPRVIGLAADVITINRGEGSGVAVDQTWEVFALGKEMVDPDTGVSLGREEVKLGEIAITDVLPKFSKARLLGDNRGIEVGAVVRPKIPKLAPSGQQ
jgi:curli biogenesis system outer membrane secretion channel CsgG